MPITETHHMTADENFADKGRELLGMAVKGDTIMVALGHKHPEQGVKYTIAVQTRRPADLAAIASSIVAQTMGMLSERDDSERQHYLLGMLNAVSVILEELVGETKPIGHDA
jgi:hypothetical protein